MHAVGEPVHELVPVQLHPPVAWHCVCPKPLHDVGDPVQVLEVLAVHPVVPEHCDEPKLEHEGEPVQLLAVHTQVVLVVCLFCVQSVCVPLELHAACVPVQVLGPLFHMQPV